MQKLLILLLACLPSLSFSQVLGSWGDLYSYNKVDDIVEMRDQTFLCAAGRALFKYDYINQEISKFSKANGLSDIDIAAIERDPVTGIIVIGYVNSNVDILDGDRIYNMPDILNSEQYSGSKNINEIVIRGDRAYIATGFGVIEVDFKERLFHDTWIVGPANTELEVFDIAFDESKDSVWLATADGLYKASNQDDLFYFANWQKDQSFKGDLGQFVDAMEGRLYVADVNPNNQDTLYIRDTSGNWAPAAVNNIGVIRALDVVNNRLMVCTNFTAEHRNADGDIVQGITPGLGNNLEFSPFYAMIASNGYWFIGDGTRGLVFVDNPNYVRKAKPLSPPSNQAYSMYVGAEDFYVAPGGVNGVWAPLYNFNGFHSLANEEWTLYGLNETDTAHDVIQILEDPIEENRFFVAAFGTGILEFRDGVLYETWDASNTNNALQGVLSPKDVRAGGMAFDADGVLWITSSLSASSLASYDRDGDWTSHSIGSFNGKELKTIAILENGDFWLQGRNDGIYAVRMDQSGTSTRHLTTGEGTGDLSSLFIHDFEEDLDGEIWIGTGEGVMVHYSPDNLFISGRNYDAQSILVLENGVYQRLLGSEGVLAVEVDGGNRKWFGTESGGVFLTSDDGLDEIYHFTKENSPLPSNRVLDVQVDPEDGVVYIATDQGIVTFNGDATGGADDMEDVTVYPNPVRPGYTGPISIRGLVQDAQVKITDVSGNLVFETRSNGGQAVWYGNDLSGNRVATGVYLAYITDELGETTAVTKILVVNGN